MENPPKGQAGQRIGPGPALHLRVYPDAVLRTLCRPVDRFDTWLADVVAEMRAVMRTSRGIGLAGPQVGIAQRLFVAEIDRQSLCVVNPVILARCGSERMVEGCLSLPGVQVDVQRDRQVEVQGYDAHGCRCRHQLEGLWARVVQHEIDHLNGVLICDKAQQNI